VSKGGNSFRIQQRDSEKTYSCFGTEMRSYEEILTEYIGNGYDFSYAIATPIMVGFIDS
jgi:hypothetical protein